MFLHHPLVTQNIIIDASSKQHSCPNVDRKT